MLYSWEQNDRGGTAGTSLLSNTKTNGPLFAMFPKSGQISLADSLQYNSPGENHLTTDPTRVFPDLQQILDNNTNADTGACPAGPIAQPVLQGVTECFCGVPADHRLRRLHRRQRQPALAALPLHRPRSRMAASTAAIRPCCWRPTPGPFLVTSPNTAVLYTGGSTQTVTWNLANTNVAPVNTANVKISLSTDGGYTYPYVLAASTAERRLRGGHAAQRQHDTGADQDRGGR